LPNYPDFQWFFFAFFFPPLFLTGGQVELIFETWHAHLLKARTWVVDAHNNKVGEGSPSAAHLDERDVFDLTDAERAAYIAKQDKLNAMGVTALLATVVASLSGSQCRLTDSATMLFIELLNGGNATVQVRHLAQPAFWPPTTSL
jgi:hypothetical protein